MVISKSNNGWELYTIANGHLSCENFELDSGDIDKIEEILKPEFENVMKSEHIIVAYDNWSGVFIMQSPGFKTGHADEVIRKIYEFLAHLESI